MSPLPESRPEGTPTPSLNALLALDSWREWVESRAQLYCVVLDSSGVVRFANDYAQRICGPSMVGAPFSSLVVSFTAPFSMEFCATTTTDARPLSIQTTTGLPRTFYFTCLQVEGSTVLIGENNQEDLDVLRRNLIEANNELSNLTRKYQKANVDLAKLNQQKNQFLGMAAHDLRNPLVAIMAYADFLLEEGNEIGAERLSFLNIIKESSRYMLSLLEELLDIAKIESGKLQLNLTTVSLYELVRKSVDLNRRIAERKGITIQLFSREHIPETSLDPLKIEQVINNLISNAIKYSHEGTTVEVSIFRAGDFATVAVKDQGIGIAAADLTRIFQPFTKLKHAGTAGESSTGLGLAIVQRIVVGHGGRIWVESKEGNGSTFYFTVPLRLT